MPRIASWGTAEDRPEREALRALLIGRLFMAAYREARGGKDAELSWWFDWVKEHTAAELQWMWSNDRAYKNEHTDAYAQVAGDIILKSAAAHEVDYTDDWFRTDISDLYGWLFEPACLRYDGWELVTDDDGLIWVKPNKKL